ncbi:MAG: DUF6544 family protein [Chromatocurvus sp.]
MVASILLVALFAIMLLILALAVLAVIDRRANRIEWRRLSALQPSGPPKFDLAMIADLPAAARRYFTFTIKPGTPLFSVAEIDMSGQFSLGTKDRPAYQPMRARQILAVPEGFVWAMRTRGGMPISGSDAAP